MYGSHLTARVWDLTNLTLGLLSWAILISAFLVWMLYQDLSELGKSQIVSWCFAKWSVKSFHFLLSRNATGRAVAMWWQGTRTLQETAMLIWPGRISATKSNPIQKPDLFTTASVHSELMDAEKEAEVAFHMFPTLNCKVYSQPWNSTRTAPQEGNSLQWQSVTRSLCFQTLTRCPPFAWPALSFEACHSWMQQWEPPFNLPRLQLSAAHHIYSDLRNQTKEYQLFTE